MYVNGHAVIIGDCLPLALEWELFDFVHTLATSVNSEDHYAVLPLLRSLVALLRNGRFRDELLRYKNGDSPAHDASNDSSLKTLIQSSTGLIRTKWALIGHLKYYLHYLYAVSPTEGQMLSDVNSLLDDVEKHIAKATGNDESDNNQKSSPERLSEPVKMEVDSKSAESAAPASRPPLHPEPECVLCKFNVPGT